MICDMENGVSPNSRTYLAITQIQGGIGIGAVSFEFDYAIKNLKN